MASQLTHITKLFYLTNSSSNSKTRHTHRPDLVITISVPFLWNSVQSSLCSSVTLGSSLTLSSSGGGGRNPGPGPKGKPGKRGNRPGYPEIWRQWTLCLVTISGPPPTWWSAEAVCWSETGKMSGREGARMERRMMMGVSWHSGHPWQTHLGSGEQRGRGEAGHGVAGGRGTHVIVTCHVSRVSRGDVTKVTCGHCTISIWKRPNSSSDPDLICNCWCRIKGWKETGFKSENLK